MPESILKGQIAVVTGAGSGIGKAIGLGLAMEGAEICLVGRSRQNLEALLTLPKIFPIKFPAIEPILQ